MIQSIERTRLNKSITNLFSLSVGSFVGLNIKLSFLIEGLFIFFRFFYDLASHFFFPLLLFLQSNSILPASKRKIKKRRFWYQHISDSYNHITKYMEDRWSCNTILIWSKFIHIIVQLVIRVKVLVNESSKSLKLGVG